MWLLDPPPNVLKPQDVSVIPGDNALFTCIAFSTVDFNLTWVRYNSTLSEYVELADNAEVFANGSLVVRCVAFYLRLDIYSPHSARKNEQNK